MHLDQFFFKNIYKCLPPLKHLFLIVFALLSCNEKTIEKKEERSFYYWKSVLKSTNYELKQLDSLQVKTIYLKFFDVDWDASSEQAIPVAKLQVRDKRLLKNHQIIPTVFITNETIQKIDSNQMVLLAGKIHQLILDICITNQINKIDEIQIDCDWSESSKEKYFSLLKIIKKISAKSISATIRLHQIKFLSRNGVPPADRGLLMCYNMANLKNPATRNSILSVSELKKYTGNLYSYPLPLDVALPLFEWKVLFRNNIYSGLIENMPGDIFTNSFTLKNDNRIELLKDTFLAGYDLKKGDILRSEDSKIEDVLAAANEVKRHLKNTIGRVSLFHLDSVILNKYSTHELESIYKSFY